jgi:Tfp pilus assembly protein PilV
MSRFRERGFSAVEVVIAVLVIAGVVIAGWYMFNRMKDKNADTSTTSQQSSDSPAVAPEVSDTSDLDTANNALDNTDLNASTTDANELDTELNSF